MWAPDGERSLRAFVSSDHKREEPIPEEIDCMKTPLSRYVVPALLAAAIPAGFALAQAQPQPQAEPQQTRERPRLSEDALKRLQDGRVEGRIAEIKETLKLNEAQMKLFAPVEEQIRVSSAARQKARTERRERRHEAQDSRPPLTERLDRAAQRMTERAQRMQAFATAFKPFYESLSEEQKAVAGIVLRDMRGLRGHWRRWAMEHHRGHGPRGGAPDGERPMPR
jgi:hypothetical protein